MSPSSRRAWVEIRKSCSSRADTTVALLAEGVGRNTGRFTAAGYILVALLAEGVGRNQKRAICLPAAYVALLAEGVGRNAYARLPPLLLLLSPSSRRAWVEMLYHC